MPGADAKRLPVFHEHDRIRFDVLHHTERKEQIVHLLRGGRAFADELGLRGADRGIVRRLQQQAATDTLEVVKIVARAKRHLQHAHVLLVFQHGQRLRAIAGRDQHFQELCRHCLRCRGVDFAIESDDAAEG